MSEFSQLVTNHAPQKNFGKLHKLLANYISSYLRRLFSYYMCDETMSCGGQ